jgi:hypothetical protein
MDYVVNFSSEFQGWLEDQPEDLQDTVLMYIRLLEQYGPQLSRPQADTLVGSALSNLKELRVQHRGEPYRLLYAFDPNRQALILLGGNKASDKRWYEIMIPKAEAIFKAHLKNLQEEDNETKNLEQQSKDKKIRPRKTRK